MSGMLERQTDLPSHLVQFVRFLREKDFGVGPSEELDYLMAFSAKAPVSFKAQEDLCRALFAKNRNDFLRFNELYKSYWSQLSAAEDSKTKESRNSNKKIGKNSAPSLKALKSWLHGGRISETEDMASFSALEALTGKDFSMFAPEEHHELRAIIRLLAKRMANKYNRRFKRSGKHSKLDLKNTIRDALMHGGEIANFKFHQRKKKKVHIILLCDVSKSMELYSKFLIEFMYNFQQINHTLRTFAFSTHLSPLTRLLKEGDFEKVLHNLGEEVPQWSGGTRIGESLYQLVSRYPQLLRKDPIVMILSDGWDTGNLDLLGESMGYIHKKSEKLIWLNPLAGNPGYEPSTRAMQVCLPFIDVLLPLYNLKSLRNIVHYIKIQR